MTPIFITGIGTGVGKTVASAVVTESLQADYWKPIQAGFDDGTDALAVKDLISNSETTIHPEVYKLALPASPHIAARHEGVEINITNIVDRRRSTVDRRLVIEGAGGIMVPVNDTQFVIDVIEQLQAKVILVSRNYLGSINHSLLTASICKQRGINVIGWIFNDQYLDYEQEIVNWSGYPKIGSIPFAETLDKTFVKTQADAIRLSLQQLL
ncbi:dethiobiotin synthase [Parasediminibacterium paludis]|uniref:ATP-dependent dethiobiotin synthetase BioD n=1 Tax=Parasediminibacterium paludis TaxID=908966 RepID=A0ABV8PSR3_9BACT